MKLKKRNPPQHVSALACLIKWKAYPLGLKQEMMQATGIVA